MTNIFSGKLGSLCFCKVESVVPSKDGFKFGEHLSYGGQTDKIITKSRNRLIILTCTLSFDNRRNDLFSGDALQELDSVGNVLNSESLIPNESALNASETPTVSLAVDVEKVEKDKKKNKKKKKSNSQKNEPESDIEKLELNSTTQVIEDSN